MPTYKEEKIKEMMRSILPSTDRKNSKYYKTLIRREDRRKIRQVLKAEIGFIDDDEELHIDESIDLKDDMQKRLSPIIRDRRGNDKINHFVRWAKSITKDIDDGNKVSFVKSIAPKNIIGDHAISHLEGVIEVRNPYEYRSSAWRNVYKRINIYDYEWVFKYILTQDLRLLKLFNNMIIEKNPNKDKVRTLQSLLDIKDFMNDVVTLNEKTLSKKIIFVRKTSKIIYAPKRTKDKDLKNPREKIIIDIQTSRKKITYYTYPNYNPYILDMVIKFIKSFIKRCGDYQMIKNDLKIMFYSNNIFNQY